MRSYSYKSKSYNMYLRYIPSSVAAQMCLSSLYVLQKTFGMSLVCEDGK